MDFCTPEGWIVWHCLLFFCRLNFACLCYYVLGLDLVFGLLGGRFVFLRRLILVDDRNMGFCTPEG